MMTLLEIQASVTRASPSPGAYRHQPQVGPGPPALRSSLSQALPLGRRGRATCPRTPRSMCPFQLIASMRRSAGENAGHQESGTCCAKKYGSLNHGANRNPDIDAAHGLFRSGQGGLGIMKALSCGAGLQKSLQAPHHQPVFCLQRSVGRPDAFCVYPDSGPLCHPEL